MVLKKGKAIIFTAPSGAGKSTLIASVLKKYKNLQFSISATTRKPRKNEVNGKDYYFMDNNEFKSKIKEGGFIEWEQVYEDTYYGTLKSEINRIWDNNNYVIFDIDVLGAISLLHKLKNNCISIFIQPPSLDTLKKRLIKRNTDTAKELEKRINRATLEIKYKNSFDYNVINDNIETATNKVINIIDDYLKK